MGGKLTATLNTNGVVCAIQKAGGHGVIQSVIMQFLRIASVKAADITNKIKKAVSVLHNMYTHVFKDLFYYLKFYHFFCAG